ncbi:MAG: hypothetical protein KBD52_00345 [Candidatus Pacebacteria bacterium]|nr:hypothetical protein [Candidatus Paceibacterota bacterium]
MKNNRPVIALIVILLATTVYFGYKYYQLTQSPQDVAQAEVKKLVAEVGNLVLLPEGETPTIATVSDPEALKAQPFFAGALKDDKVLIYTTAQKAILYRPSVGKIVQIAPINIGAANNTTPAAN